MSMKPATPVTAFLLIVEDDPNVLELVSNTLLLAGYHVHSAITRTEVFSKLESGMCQAMVLDLGLPGDDGIQIARAVRERSAVPILMLTGRRGIHERVKGLEAGADDYLLKPFAPEELVARVRAVLRRAPKPAEPQKREVAVEIGGALLDIATRELRGPNGHERLTEHELRLLLALCRSEGPLRRAATYREVFQRDWDPNDRSLDVHVSNLRSKLRAACNTPGLIATVRGQGYHLRGPFEVKFDEGS
jgi:two-component system phosphate regulon response regulator OmpR